VSAAFELFRGPYGDSRVEQLRVPPYSTEAEQNVLGAIMLVPGAMSKVADMLEEGDFYRRDHQLIFRALVELSGKDIPTDSVTVGEWFESNGLGEQVAGGAYLVELASNTASAANIEAYAEIVKDKARLRQLIDLGTGMVNAGFMPEGRDTREILSDAMRDLTALNGSLRVPGAKGMREVGGAWFEALQNRFSGGPAGIITPWGKFNQIIGGLQAGDLGIVAARPSMGKSAFACNIALSAGMSGNRTMIFSMEMTAASIYNRWVASLMGVPLKWLRDPAGEGDYWPQAVEGVKRIRDAELIVDDSAGLTWQAVCSRARREHLRRPLKLVIVDHAHIMRLPGKTRADIELGDVSRELKALAKELDVPVILLAQLNRSVEKRENKRPIMSDLREAGGFEQDADWIMFLYRDDYYAEQLGRASENPGLAEAIIAKQREGETGRVWLKSMLHLGRFDECEDEPAPVQRRARGGNAFDYMTRGDQ